MSESKTLDEIVQGYYDFRNMSRPSAAQALMFLVSEVGELADAHVNQEAEWVRNNQRERNIPDEIGDVMMMLTVYAAANGCDPVGCMTDKMGRRGYRAMGMDTSDAE